jgi:hypothetical protein
LNRNSDLNAYFVIVGDHPYAGHWGRYIGDETTPLGAAKVIGLETNTGQGKCVLVFDDANLMACRRTK